MKGIKTGGRIEGTPNKTTKEIRDSYQILIEQNIDKLQNWIDVIGKENPTKAIEIILKLSEFVVPKIKAHHLIENKEMEESQVFLIGGVEVRF